MRSVVRMGLLFSLVVALGCATPGPDGAVQSAGSEEPATESTAESASEASEVVEIAPRSRTYRIGVWKLDLMALDRLPDRTVFRLLDLRIFKLLEAGGGSDDFHSFALLEAPGVLELFTTRRDGAERELRLLDVQVLALLRDTHQSSRELETHVVKLPVLGSLYGHEVQGSTELWQYLFLGRREVER